MPRRPENLYGQYHAHVYFGPDTLAQAKALCERAGRELMVVVGRVHERLVGPHPHWSCQLAFVAGHTTHAMWLGEESELDLRMFRR